MKKFAGLFVIVVLFCLPTLAQDTSKYEIGGGLAYRSFDNGNGSRINMAGWDAYGDRHIWRFINVAADFSGTYNRNNNSGNTSIYSFLVGPQLYPFGRQHKITAFAQLLFGGGAFVYHLPSQSGFNPVATSYAGAVWMGGGGLDWRVKKRWAVRIVQADYEQTRFISGSASQGNYRISIGLVYRFGIK